MAHLVSLGLWLFLVTLFLLDTLVTLTFLGRYAEPAVRLGWWTALLLVPLVTLLVSPLWAWAAPAVALAAAGGLIVHGAAYRALRRRLTAAPAEAAERIRALAEGFGLRRTPAILYDPADQLEPATVGLLRPALVMTPSALSLPEPDFRAVVAHELAHFVRRDPLRLWACGVARVLLGWHPLARRAADLFVLEVEMAADRQAVSWTGDRRAYALALARWGLRRHEGPVAMRGVAVAGASAHIVQRLTYLSDPEGAAPHVKPLLGFAGAGPHSRGRAWVRWGHLALGIAYTLLFAVLARLF